MIYVKTKTRNIPTTWRWARGDRHSRAAKKNISRGNEVLPQDTTHLIQRACYQRGSLCQDLAGNRTTWRSDHLKRRKLKWYGHVSRSSGLAKTILIGGSRQVRQKKSRGKTTSGTEQAWSSPSPRRHWLWSHLWCPNDPLGSEIGDGKGEEMLAFLLAASARLACRCVWCFSNSRESMATWTNSRDSLSARCLISVTKRGIMSRRNSRPRPDVGPPARKDCLQLLLLAKFFQKFYSAVW